MTDWNELHGDGSYVTATEPSGIVSRFARDIPPGKIADLGCGSGRNAVFLAGLGRSVDAWDIQKVENWPARLPPNLVPNIAFKELDVNDVELEAGVYGAVVATRLIQFLRREAVGHLVAQSAAALVPKGLLFISYTGEGGIHDDPAVETFTHPIDEVNDLIAASGLRVIHHQERWVSQPEQNVNRKLSPAFAHDLVARKPEEA